ncbi:hypothetical protein ZWY2020_057288 [Hordeum vulgare]|nr:hypothetical protein ZWY2020_057288 [Hordeum vulgare]
MAPARNGDGDPEPTFAADPGGGAPLPSAAADLPRRRGFLQAPPRPATPKVHAVSVAKEMLPLWKPPACASLSRLRRPPAYPVLMDCKRTLSEMISGF